MTAVKLPGSEEFRESLEGTEAALEENGPGPVTLSVGDWSAEFGLRDYFAAQAMRGFVGTVGVAAGEIPDRAYNIADRMLAHRKIKK